MRTSLKELLSYETEGVGEYAKLDPREKLKKLIEQVNDFKAGYGKQASIWLQIENSDLNVADLEKFCFYMRIKPHYIVVEAAKKKLVLQLQKLPMEKLNPFSLVFLAKQTGEIDKYLQKLLKKSYTGYCGNYYYTNAAVELAFKGEKKELALLLARRYIELRSKRFMDRYFSILDIIKDEEKLYNFSKEIKELIEEKLYDYMQK